MCRPLQLHGAIKARRQWESGKGTPIGLTHLIREQTAALMAGAASSEGFDDLSEIEDAKSTAWRWFLGASGVTHERE